MTIKAIAVDDEPLARARLVRLLTMQGVKVIAQGENGQQAIDLVFENKDVDILFIDINMPIKTGLQAVNDICATHQDPPAIVFCTAYDEYALDAFKTNAVAYLLKPIQAEDIANAIEKASHVNKFQRTNLFEQESGNKTIAVHHEGVLQNLPVTRFLFFKSENKNVFGILDNGQELLIDNTLKNLAEQFDSDFVRTHRATLMNKKQASSLLKEESGAVFVKLKDSEFNLPVSRRHLSEVKKCFQ